MSNKPLLKNKYVTVWDGQWGKQIVIEKSYKDKKSNEWKRSNKFFENELPELISALQEAMLTLGVPSNEEAQETNTNDFDDDSIPF